MKWLCSATAVGVWGELLLAAGFEVVRRCDIVYERCYVKVVDFQTILRDLSKLLVKASKIVMVIPSVD
jgi:hypothetical protein